LLATAAAAGPNDRIDYRDDIAAYRHVAIEPMHSWLRDPRLGAFAIQVMAKIAEDSDCRREVIDVLGSVDRAALSTTVGRDLSALLQRLVPALKQERGGRRPVVQWPAGQEVTDLEWRFHDAMLEIFRHAGEATRRRRPDGTVDRGYWASYFLRGVRNHGGLVYARRLLQQQGTMEGFERLKKEGRLDLTVEALVLRPEFRSLFSEQELNVASRRIGGLQPAHMRGAPSGGET
jgi:hypothetical protein